MTFTKITKASKLNLASEIVANSGAEYSQELAQLLTEESARVEKANARSRGKKTVSKAQKERAVVVEQIKEILETEKPKVFFDSIGLVKLIDLDYTPQKAIHVAKDLIELEVITEVGEQTFGDNKKRKAYALTDIDSSDLQAYDVE